LQATSGAREYPRHFVVIGRRQGLEARRRPRGLGVGVDAVERESVEVEIEIQCGAESLDEGNGAALWGSNCPVLSSAPPEFGEQGAQEGAEYFARESRVVGTAITKRVRQREHPLADRDFGKHAIDEV